MLKLTKPPIVKCDKCQTQQEWYGDIYCAICHKRMNSFLIAEQLQKSREDER